MHLQMLLPAPTDSSWRIIPLQRDVILIAAQLPQWLGYSPVPVQRGALCAFRLLGYRDNLCEQLRYFVRENLVWREFKSSRSLSCNALDS